VVSIVTIIPIIVYMYVLIYNSNTYNALNIRLSTKSKNKRITGNILSRYCPVYKTKNESLVVEHLLAVFSPYIRRIRIRFTVIIVSSSFVLNKYAYNVNLQR